MSQLPLFDSSVDFGVRYSEYAVYVHGKNDDGTLNVQLNVRTPPTSDNIPPTENQMVAVSAIFPHIPPTISQAQASAILCYRDYARAVVQRILGNEQNRYRELLVAVAATLVSHDEKIAADVRRWSDNRFLNHRGEPKIKNTKNFYVIVERMTDFVSRLKTESTFHVSTHLY